MAFNFNKAVSSPRPQMIPVPFTKKPRTVITPETIEQLAAESPLIKDIAKRLRVSASYASERIHETLTMENAFERGKQKHKEKLKTL